MTVAINLTVNDAAIKLDYFVAGFIDHTASGMIESLESTGQVHDLKLSITGDEVNIELNGSKVPVNAFVMKIFKSTFLGIIAPLKGVRGEFRNLHLEIHK
jgi:hypothetical protein